MEKNLVVSEKSSTFASELENMVKSIRKNMVTTDFENRINSIFGETLSLIRDMLKVLHKNGVIKSNQNGECEISLELPKSFDRYDKLMYNIHNNDVTAKHSYLDYEMQLEDAVIELNSAILADIAMRYFDMEEI